tara:strand:+ start:27198 stop:27770 length:573 start_codon:yes stop_codon:yes gene_type:complete
MNKIKQVVIIGACLLPLGAYAQSSISDNDEYMSKAKVSAAEAKYYENLAKSYKAQTAMIQAKQEKLKAELKAAAGETVSRQVKTDESNNPATMSGMAVTYKAEPIDSVCVTKLFGPASDLAADVWFRGKPYIGLKEGQIIAEGVRLQALYTSANRGWGIDVHHLGKTKFVPMCDLSTAKTRGVPEKTKVF